MKTLAQALEKPIVGVSSLDLIALPYRSAWPGTLVSVLYCRTEEVYCSVYDEGMQPLREPGVLRVEELNRELAEIPPPALVCGEVGPRDTLVLPPGARQSDPWLHHPHVEMLAREGCRRLVEGHGVDPMTLRVQYLKRSQAEEQADLYRQQQAVPR
jgi:tRNA A37 threonylcarbamoyladenosine modification protein TsaB